MKKKILFCWLMLLIGLPVLLVSCDPGTAGDPVTSDGATLPEATEPRPAETAEEPAAPDTDIQAPESDTPPAESDTETPETESDDGTVTVPDEVLAAIKGSEKLAEAIDYANPAHWISLPENPDKPVDVFFLYPTTYGTATGSAEEDIADIDNPEMWAGAQRSLQGQASVFAESCNVYMPAYRQLTVACMMNAVPTDSLVRFYLSRDIYHALDHFFENLNDGRPFILAGHSQGSVWITKILETYMKEHPEYLERMVAAYAIGYSVTKDYLAANPHLRFAEGATDTGVIISYNVEGPANKNQFNCVVSAGAISINPLTWTRDGTHAPASLNPGSLNHQHQLTAQLADARVDTERGVVICESIDPALYSMDFPQAFGTQSYHNYDYSLYYVSLRLNVAARVEAYLNAVS